MRQIPGRRASARCASRRLPPWRPRKDLGPRQNQVLGRFRDLYVCSFSVLESNDYAPVRIPAASLSPVSLTPAVLCPDSRLLTVRVRRTAQPARVLRAQQVAWPPVHKRCKTPSRDSEVQRKRRLPWAVAVPGGCICRHRTNLDNPEQAWEPSCSFCCHAGLTRHGRQKRRRMRRCPTPRPLRRPRHSCQERQVHCCFNFKLNTTKRLRAIVVHVSGQPAGFGG